MYPHEAQQRAAQNPKLAKAIGKGALLACCLRCTMASCAPASGGCIARQLKTERQRDYYARTALMRRAEAKRYYRANKGAMRARSAAYQRDPLVLDVMATKRRMRYAKRAADDGRTVRPYNWTNPSRNKPNHSTQRTA